ncbi:MAG: hypothetical protein ACRDSH_05850, partial [Pseudonocardiaceae bacterium]
GTLCSPIVECENSVIVGALSIRGFQTVGDWLSTLTLSRMESPTSARDAVGAIGIAMPQVLADEAITGRCDRAQPRTNSRKLHVRSGTDHKLWSVRPTPAESILVIMMGISLGGPVGMCPS